jgi:long-chain acyl-CoA synthetase
MIPRPFWSVDELRMHASAVCGIWRGRSYTYAEIADFVEQTATALNHFGIRSPGIMRCESSPAWLVAYLASLNAGQVPILLPSELPSHAVDTMRQRYRSAWTWQASTSHARDEATRNLADVATAGFCRESTESAPVVHPELTLLLSTSGSTGSPKLVRLSARALAANAASIAQYLRVDGASRAMTTLPVSYSYGLSVINSHLVGGGSIVFSEASLMSRDFSHTVAQEQVTTLAGVPSWYQMLLRTGPDRVFVPSLRTLTQAGGHLDQTSKRSLLDRAEVSGVSFVVMYGQTEATARISYVPPEALRDHLDSIGIPIPGGTLALDDESHEIIYLGPNVMMGYATAADDLARPDECGGVLRTGDLGAVDADGFFSVTGRIKRFIKIAGNRVGLDDVEAMLREELGSPVAVTGRDGLLGIWVSGTDHEMSRRAHTIVQTDLRIHHTQFRISVLGEIPLTQNGKVDYTMLLHSLG